MSDRTNQSPDLYQYSITNSDQSNSINISRSLQEFERIRLSNNHRVSGSNRSLNNDQFMGVHLEVVCLLQAAEIERLGNDLKELTMKKSKHDTQYEKYKTQIQELKNYIESLQSTLASNNSINPSRGNPQTQFQLQSIRKRNQELQAKYEKSLHQISILYDQNTELQEKIYTIESRLHETSVLKDQLESSKMSEFEKYKSSYEKHQKAEIQQKKQQIRRLKDSLTVIKKEKDSYLSQSNRLAWQVEELKQLQKQNVQYENKIVLLSHQLERVNRLKNQKTKEIEKLKQENQGLRSQNESLSQQIREARYILESDKTQKEQKYQKLLEEKSQQVAHLSSKNHQLLLEIEQKQAQYLNQTNILVADHEYKIKSQASEHKKQLYELENSQIKLKFENERIKEENQIHHKNNQELKVKLETAEKQIQGTANATRTQQTNYQNIIEKYELSLRQYQNRLTEGERQRSIIKQNYQSKVNNTISDYEAQFNRLSEEIKELRKQNRSLGGLQQVVSGLQTKNSMMEQEISRIASQNQRARQELQTLYKSQIEQLNLSHNQQLTDLEGQNITLKGELQKLYESTINDKQSNYKHFKEAQKIFGDRQRQVVNRLQKLEHEFNDAQIQLKQTLRSLSDNIDKLRALQQKIPGYEKQLLGYRNKLLIKEQQLNNKTIQFENRLQKITQESQELSKSLNQSELKNKQIMEEYHTIYTKLEECEQVLAEQYQRNQNLQASMRDVSIELQQQRDQSNQQIKSYIEQMEKMRNQVEAKLREQTTVINSQQQQMAITKKSIDEKQRIIEHKIAQINEMRQKVTNLTFQIDQQKTINQQINQQIGNLSNRNALLEQQIMLLRQKTSHLLDECDNKSDQLYSLGKDRQIFVVELDQLKAKLHISEQECLRIKEQIKMLEDKTFRVVKQKSQEKQQLERKLNVKEKQLGNISLLLKKTEEQRQNFQIFCEEMESLNSNLKNQTDMLAKQRDICKTQLEMLQSTFQRKKREYELSISDRQFNHKQLLTQKETCLSKIHHLQQQLALIYQQKENIDNKNRQSLKITRVQLQNRQRSLIEKQSIIKRLEEEVKRVRQQCQQQNRKYYEGVSKHRAELNSRDQMHEEQLSSKNREFLEQLNKIKTSNHNNIKQLQKVFQEELNYKQALIGKLEEQVRNGEQTLNQTKLEIENERQKQASLLGQLQQEIQQARGRYMQQDALKQRAIQQIRNFQQMMSQKTETIAYLEAQIDRKGRQINEKQDNLRYIEAEHKRQINIQEQQYERLFIQINKAIQHSEQQFNRLYQYLQDNIIKNQRQHTDQLSQIHDMQEQSRSWRNNNDVQRIKTEQEQLRKLCSIQSLLQQLKAQLTSQNQQIIAMTRQISQREQQILDDTEEIRRDNRQILANQRNKSEELGNICRNLQEKIQWLETNMNQLNQEHQYKQLQHQKEIQRRERVNQQTVSLLESKLQRYEIQIEAMRNQFIQREEQYKERITDAEAKMQNKYLQVIGRYEENMKIKDLQLNNLNQTLALYKNSAASRMRDPDNSKLSRSKSGASLTLNGHLYPSTQEYQNKIILLSQEVQRLQSLLNSRTLVHPRQYNEQSSRHEYSSNEEVKKLSQKCQFFQQKSSQLQSKLDKLGQKFKEVNKQLLKYTSVYTKLYDNFMTMETKISSFERTLLIFRDSYHQMQQKQVSNHRAIQQTNQLKRQIYELKVEIEKLSYYENKIVILKEQIGRLEKLNIDLKGQIVECRLYCTQGDTISKRIEEMMAIMVLQSVEIQSLRDQLNNTQIEQQKSSRVKQIMQESKSKRSRAKTKEDRIKEQIVINGSGGEYGERKHVLKEKHYFLGY